MQAILLVTVFSCLLAAANGTPAALNATCTAADGCADANAECSGTSPTCGCKSGYTEYSTGCAITHGTAGGDCITPGSTCTGDTLVCESPVCKLKAGQTCTSSSPCVSSSTCSTTCTCNNGFSAASTGLCTAIAEGKVNAVCDATRNCTGVNDACTNGFCTCKAGFSGNKGDADCSGVAPQSVSSWLLLISIIMCLVTLSLP